jgi:hypothetical protein
MASIISGICKLWESLRRVNGNDIPEAYRHRAKYRAKYRADPTRYLMREDGSPATKDVARGYWAGAKDAGLRAQAGAYRFADDRDDQPTSPN